MAEGLRARQVYLPSGEGSHVFCLEKKIEEQSSGVNRLDSQMDVEMEGWRDRGRWGAAAKVRNKEKTSKRILGCPGGFGQKAGAAGLHLMSR